jgi:hypothetical protein
VPKPTPPVLAAIPEPAPKPAPEKPKLAPPVIAAIPEITPKPVVAAELASKTVNLPEPARKEAPAVVVVAPPPAPNPKPPVVAAVVPELPKPAPVIPKPAPPAIAAVVPAPPKPKPVAPLIAAVPPAPKPIPSAIKALPKPAPVAAASPDKNNLNVKIWDYDGLDYDSVSLKLNGKQIGSASIALKLYSLYKSQDFTYPLDMQSGENTLEIYAISEGLKPFTTICLQIMYEDKPKKLYFKLKAKESTVIRL